MNLPGILMAVFYFSLQPAYANPDDEVTTLDVTNVSGERAKPYTQCRFQVSEDHNNSERLWVEIALEGEHDPTHPGDLPPLCTSSFRVPDVPIPSNWAETTLRRDAGTSWVVKSFDGRVLRIVRTYPFMRQIYEVTVDERLHDVQSIHVLLQERVGATGEMRLALQVECDPTEPRSVP